jgi:hypothetical protein
MRFGVRRAFIAAILGAGGLFVSSAAAPAASCAPEGNVGDVIIGGVGGIDLDNIGTLAPTACFEVTGHGVYVFPNIDPGGNFADANLRACVFTSADQAVCSMPGTTTYLDVNVGLGTSDLPKLATSSGCVFPASSPCTSSPVNGVAVELFGDDTEGSTNRYTVRVLINDADGIADSDDLVLELPRVCIEVGAYCP